MSIRTIAIHSLADLSKALAQPEPCNLELQNSVLSPYSIALPRGFSLTGKDKNSCVLSFCNGDGVGLTADNRVANLTILATPAARAIYTQTGLPDMGSIALNELSVTGQVSIIMRGGTKNLRAGGGRRPGNPRCERHHVCSGRWNGQCDRYQRTGRRSRRAFGRGVSQQKRFHASDESASRGKGRKEPGRCRWAGHRSHRLLRLDITKMSSPVQQRQR